MKHFMTACMVLLAAISCNKNNLTPKTEGPVEIAFSADDSFSAEVITKAASVVTSLESSGFNASATKGTSGSETQVWNNAPFTYSSTDQKYKGNKYWPLSSTQMHFYASNQTLAFTASGCTVNATTDDDVVCAYVASPTWNMSVTNLTFNHIFSRIGKCTITAPAGYTASGLSVTITPKTGGTYNLRTAQWSDVTTASSTTLVTQFDDNNDIDLYLIPDTYEIKANYTLSKGGDGGYSESFSKKAYVILPAGQISNISATLPSGNEKEIVFSVTVTPWTTQTLNANFQ
ncbi:MAG: fimbrillin family protein [Bacteroidales bacterium]|nr:fimbrillin family protein [Bacteroidales bacterium]